MSNSSGKTSAFPRVPNFYEGKSVFITGSAGFLGVVLLEALLRLCPGIERIYILLRAKKGVQPENRKEFIFNKPVFNKLKKSHPDVFGKVHVISGDVSQPYLGMDEISLLKIIQNVSIVFHCAASISFIRPLKYIMAHNSAGTQHTIEVCRKLKKLDALVYTSTAFSNCNRNIEIEEEIYRLPFPANKFLDQLYNEKDDSLHELVSQCQPSWPNYYTFSKCLAENIIQDNASDLPIAIIRPSLILSVWKEPLPGYVEDTSGISALSVGTGKGFIKILHADPEVKLDLIPVDVVAHTHIIAAMRVASDRTTSPWIVNCTSFDVCTLRDYTSIMLELISRHPLPKTFRTPTTLAIKKNPISYWLIAIYEHYLPAIIMDLFLKCSGSKVRLVPIYRFVESAISATNFFMTNSWTYQTKNFQKLMKELNFKDKQIFTTNVKGCSLKTLSEDIPKSAPFFQWENDKKSVSDRMSIASRRYWMTTIIQTGVIAGTCWLMYLLFSLFQKSYSFS